MAMASDIISTEFFRLNINFNKKHYTDQAHTYDYVQ